jgi:hypothetical protein
MELDIRIGGKPEKFRTGRLNARQQFHVARRLGPILVARLQGMAAMTKMLGLPTAEGAQEAAEPAPEALVPEDVMAAGFIPAATALARMPDADADFVLTTCLGVCSRMQGSQWAPVQASNGKMMFEDIGMQEMMQLVNAVVKENLGDFFPDPLGGATAPRP